jgi:hypothetical protein
VGHGRPSRLRAFGQPGGDRGRGAVADAIGHAAQELGEDHAGIAASAEQSTPGQIPERLPSPGGLLGIKLVAGRHHGQVHVGPGVPVGHGIHVELVDLAPMAGESRDGALCEAADGVGVEYLQHGLSLVVTADTAPVRSLRTRIRHRVPASAIVVGLPACAGTSCRPR